MMKLTWIDFFLKLIPESFIIIWAIHAISNKVISKKRYIIYCILISIEVYVVRLLPIHFGVHTIINNIFTICLLIISEFSITIAIRNTLLMTSILLISECFNVVLLKVINVNTQLKFEIPGVRSLLFIPSLLLFILLIYLVKLLLIRGEGKINVIS